MSININANMSLGAAEYLDARQSVVTLDDLLNLNTNIIPNGFECYVQDLDCKYKYHEDYNESGTGNWKLISVGEATESDIIVAHTPDEADALQKKVNRNKLMFYMGNTKSSYVHGELYYLHWNAITIKKFYTKGGGILEIDYDVLEQKYASYSQTITFKAEYKQDTTNVTNRWFCEYSGGSGSRLDVVGVNISNGSATLGDVIEFTYNSASKNSDNYTWKPLFVKPQRTFEKNWWLVNKIATYGGGYDDEFVNGHRYQFTADITINATASGNIVVSLDEEQYKNYFGLHSKSSFTYNADTGCFEYRYGMINYEDNRFTIEYLNKAGITWTGEIANGDTITVTCTMSDDINDYYWKDLDAESGENNVEDFYYKTLPTEPLVFSQGSVAIRKDNTTGLVDEYVDESSTNRLKTDEYINCNDLYYEINVPSEYTLMTRTYTKDDDGNMVALTNIPEFNGVFTIKDIIYSRLSVPSAPATQEEILEHYRQNNLYFRFCLKRLDNADFTPETNEVVVLKYTEEANKDALKSYVLSEDYLYNSIYYDCNRQVKNITGENNLNSFIASIVNKPDFDGTLVLPRRTYKMSYAITIDTSKIKVFDGNNSEFIMTSTNNRAVFEITGSLDSSMTSNPNTLNAEIMNKEPNTIIRNCIIRGDTNEDGTYKNNGIGITLSGAIKTKIENCYIHHMATGIKLTNVCRNISICNNHIYTITGNGISLEDTNIHQLNINSNFITYCMNCIYVKPKELANLQMNGNDIEIGLYPTGYENARCLNFDISSTSNSCFEIEICGNTIQGHSASGNLIQFLGGTNPIQNVSIVGNHISNSNGTGIVLQDCKGFAIQGNTMKDIDGYIYDLKGTVSYTNIQGNIGSKNCDNVITTPASAVLEHIAYVDNITTGSTTSVLATQKTDVVIQLKTNNSKAYTTLEELGLTADATFQDVIDKLPKGASALLGVTEFTNYQTIFPYEEGNDQFGRVYIVKGTEDGGRVYARWFRKDGVKEAIAIFNINDNKFGGWRMLKNQQVYTSIKELGLDTTATINDIIGAMKDGTTFTYKTDVFDYATEYNNIQLGTVTINKQSTARVQTLMTDKSTGDLYVGKLDSTNRIVGWQRMIGENSWVDPYSCAGYKRLTGTEDLFTLGTGHYVTEKANTAYNYPITDTSNLTAHIYVLGALNDPTNNKGYRIILYFDNKGRMYRINEWWGVFTDNGWQEIITKDYVDSKHNYSTTETAIGTWIDGKTIYRKTFTKSPTSDQSNGNQVTIDVATISGLTNVIDIQATAKLYNYNNTSAPIYAKIPFSEMWRSYSGSSGAAVYSVYVEGTTLKLHANSCTSDDIYYITVEYTK